MTSETSEKPYVAIVYYSMYGHIRTMAASVAEGLKESIGDEYDVKLFQVPETLSEEVLGKLGAAGMKSDDPIATPDVLAEAAGVMFGIPTRFGMAAAQMKAFMDSTGGLWMKGALIGKPAGIFFSTGTQGGGQETTALTFVTQLTHHGMIFVPLGYADPTIFNMEEVHGGSPYGSGTFAGPDGSRMPSDLEKGLAHTQGKNFGSIVKKLA